MAQIQVERLKKLVAPSYEEIMFQRELFNLATKAREMESKLRSVKLSITATFDEGLMCYDSEKQVITFSFANNNKGMPSGLPETREESINCIASRIYELLRANYLVKAGYVDRYSNDLMSLEEIDVQQDARLYELFMKFYCRIDPT
ncbi:MAG: hypothetical protein HFJ50_00510 [Clostridia bacterium]|nr:hypothetical protein [Clostridia bacterium]